MTPTQLANQLLDRGFRTQHLRFMSGLGYLRHQQEHHWIAPPRSYFGAPAGESPFFVSSLESALLLFRTVFDAPSQGSDDGSDSDAPASSASGDDEEPGSAGPPTDGGSSSDDESSDETHLSRSRSRSRAPRDPPPPPHDSDDESAPLRLPATGQTGTQWSQWTTGPASQRAASQWATPPPPEWDDALRRRLGTAAPVDAANAACVAYAADERARAALPTMNVSRGDVDVLFAPDSWE